MNIIEDDICTICKVALDFAPDKSIHELWNGTNVQGVLKNKGWSDTVITEKYQQIMDAFDAI